MKFTCNEQTAKKRSWTLNSASTTLLDPPEDLTAAVGDEEDVEVVVVATAANVESVVNVVVQTEANDVATGKEDVEVVEAVQVSRYGVLHTSSQYLFSQESQRWLSFQEVIVLHL